MANTLKERTFVGLKLINEIKNEKMKKTWLAVSAFMLLTLICPNLRAACATSLPVTSTSVTAATKADEQDAIMARVYEIKKMDKSNLSPTEKKGLRVELRSLKKRYRENGGIYISVGGAIIIILLLILILR